MTTATAPTPPATQGLTARAWALLAVLCGAVFLEGIDVSMLGVALPSIRADLDMSTSSLQWIVSAYVLGYGGFVLLGGRAADLLGRRRMFLIGLGVFIAFSALGGLGTEGWMLIVARFVTGISAGFITPAALSIITTTFPEGPARNKAVLIYAATGAGGFLFGLVAGGLLTTIGWRWVFFAPVVVGSLLLVAAVRLLPADALRRDGPRRFDLTGAASVTAAMLLLVMGVARASDVGAETTAATMAAGLVLLAAFVAVERRSPAPLLRLGILRSAPLVRANLGAGLFIGAFISFQFVLVLYLQELRGWSPLESGLVLLIAGLDVALAPTLTPKLVDRFGTTPVILAGMLVAAAAYGLFLPVGPDWGYLQMLPSLVLLGIAFALAYGALTIAATDGIAEDEQGLAGGLLNVSFQFGAALGLAIAAAVNVAATGAGGSPDALLDGYRSAFLVPVAAVVVGAAITAAGLRRPAKPQYVVVEAGIEHKL